ncbi:MAG TPA: glycoside hydrolase family 2 TIM barrel-domain containing protein, partial [Fimbriimonadaceae bacterium]|nr:glycoside hydrolase family 2 TIM barrel-domain containing protein [Fimbriimonadaceae bacterium]
IEAYWAVPDLKSSTIRVTAFSDEMTGEIEAEVRLKGKPVSKASFKVGSAFSIPVPQPALWSPESPTLYDLKLTLVNEGKKVDQVDGYFAMREMTLGKDKAGITRLFLNGKPTFQYGPLDQGFWPDGLYSPPTDAALKFDIEAAKKMGCNMLRKHVKVESERFYHHCDKLGILVWQDMPSGDFPKDKGAAYEHEWPKIIKARYNHPSIVMWIPFNEGWGQYDTERIVDMTRRLDPHRLVNNASGWTDKGVGDVLDIHSYPGPSTPQWEPKRAAVLGEFGGLGLPVEGHTWVEKNNWGYVSYKTQEELTAAYIDLLKRTHDLIPLGLSAAVYTQTTDVEVEVNGWLTYDRKVWKIDPKKVASVTKALYGPPATYTMVVPVQRPWKYSFTQPVSDWMSAGFDDSTWATGKGSFGTEGTPGAVVGTEWKTSDIWIRRKFDLAKDAIDGNLRLWIHHDEDAKVYLNGVLAADLKNYVSNYIIVPIDSKALKALKAGENTIAIHCKQTRGGQNIDCGLMRVDKP